MIGNEKKTFYPSDESIIRYLRDHLRLVNPSGGTHAQPWEIDDARGPTTKV
mgnify:CR=1 FL=1